jgi:hypothetical protein
MAGVLEDVPVLDPPDEPVGELLEVVGEPARVPLADRPPEFGEGERVLRGRPEGEQDLQAELVAEQLERLLGVEVVGRPARLLRHTATVPHRGK